MAEENENLENNEEYQGEPAIFLRKVDVVISHGEGKEPTIIRANPEEQVQEG